MKTPRIYAIFKKEVYEIRRDRYTLGIAIILPLIILFLFGYSLNYDVKNTPTAVFDQDQSFLSRQYLQKIDNLDSFEVTYFVRSYAEIEELFDRDQAKAAVVIPRDFAKNIVSGLPVEVQTIVNGVFPPSAGIVVAYTTGVNEIYSAEIIADLLNSQGEGEQIFPAVQPEERVWYNSSLESKNFIVSGLFAVILMTFPPLLSTLAIVREKEHGSIQQVLISPARPVEFILGKILPYAIIAFGEMLIILGASVFWFKVPFIGSLALFLILGNIYVFCTVGIGVLISTVMKSQIAAMLLVIVVTVMPAMLFSGFIFPIFNMPPLFQGYTYLFPARYFVDISRDILLKGNGLKEMQTNIIILFFYTVGIISLAALNLKKRVD